MYCAPASMPAYFFWGVLVRQRPCAPHVRRLQLSSLRAFFLRIPQEPAIRYNGAMATHKTVDETTLENLLYLSRLSPSSTDMATLKKQVDEIVGYFDILSKYDDSENPYDAYPSTKAEALREDEIVAGLDIPDVKKITDKFMDGYFQVPKVLGEGA